MKTMEKPVLRPVEITEIKQCGMGDRVCVDLLSEFHKGEGMLVGSLSKGLFLVHSETIENPYVSTRPFRVNAGPVSAYVLVPGGKTKYLMELEGSDRVLLMDYTGRKREAGVCRIKTETRPLIMIKAKHRYNGEKEREMKLHTFLQNAETIRLVEENGNAKSVVDLKVGDKVLALVENPIQAGRHFGMSVEETIIEK